MGCGVATPFPALVVEVFEMMVDVATALSDLLVAGSTFPPMVPIHGKAWAQSPPQLLQDDGFNSRKRAAVSPKRAAMALHCSLAWTK